MKSRKRKSQIREIEKHEDREEIEEIQTVMKEENHEENSFLDFSPAQRRLEPGRLSEEQDQAGNEDNRAICSPGQL